MKLLKVKTLPPLPPAPPVPPGACFMCRKQLTLHVPCRRCEGSGKGFVKRALEREYGSCDLCDGWGTECPRVNRLATLEEAAP